MQSEARGDRPNSNGATPHKYRIRFRKAGDLRLVSHHDLMHVFERMFRRANLRFSQTQGFNPRPRMWFALSLALGIAGLREVFELELADPIPSDELHSQLTRQCPPGLEILDVRPLEGKKSARVRRAFYRLPLEAPPVELSQRIEIFLASTHHWADRLRPHPRRIDIRPFVQDLRIEPDGLWMALWITPYGAARPEEIVAALGLRSVLDDGAVIERTDMELYDEATDPTPPNLPTMLPEDARGEVVPPSPRAEQKQTPLMSGPLSFET